MANGKSSTARRREVRRNLPKTQPGWRELLRRREVGWASFFGFCFALIATFLALPIHNGPPAVHPGQVMTEPVVSRVDFAVEDKAATELDRRERASRVLPQFTANTDLMQRLNNAFNQMPRLGMRYESYQDIPKAERSALSLSEEGFKQLQQIAGDPELTAQWDQTTRLLITRVFESAIIKPGDLSVITPRNQVEVRIAVHHPAPGASDPVVREKRGRAILTAQGDGALSPLYEQLSQPVALSLRPSIQRILAAEVDQTYLYNPALTESFKESARAAVEPRVEAIRENQVIASPGTRADSQLAALINQEHQAYLSNRNPAETWVLWGGLFALNLLFAAGMWAYFFAYAPKIVRNPARGFAISALLLLSLAASVTTATIWPDFIVGSVTFPALFAAVVLAIAYDQRFALAVGVILSMVVVLSLKLPVATVMVILVGVGVAVMQLREIRSRSKLVIVGVYAGLAMGLAALIVGLATRPVLMPGVAEALVIDTLAAVTSGFFTGMLVQVALPLIERVFNVTTAMTLKELNDASHPLLQRLAHEAAGTYQHSLRIADMAEAAAEAIDADGLLCRVGAMYHDIGKTNKPQYFIENQGGGPNKHNKLSPAMSLLIIVGHVKDGVEMAREFALPANIRHFIESHHGTTLVEYFYHQAKQQTKDQDKTAPSEFEFRYPGPRPRTKEAAIMMICDCVEGAARAMDDPTPTRLENLVRTMANKRLMDGQFDDCDLTLQDLSRIEAAVTKSLCAMYHSRIKYPGDKKQQATEPSPAARPAAG
ncbi:MAG: HDIG domain-containing metalloprotein [Planctomycetota bacterium]